MPNLEINQTGLGVGLVWQDKYRKVPLNLLDCTKSQEKKSKKVRKGWGKKLWRRNHVISRAVLQVFHLYAAQPGVARLKRLFMQDKVLNLYKVDCKYVQAVIQEMRYAYKLYNYKGCQTAKGHSFS